MKPYINHKILPVIHVKELDQAIRNTRIAREQGADGVFLINHNISYRQLLKIHHKVFLEFSDWWIGINCLDLAPCEIFDQISEEVAGVWADNAMIDEYSEKQPTAEMIRDARRMSGWPGLYFGGVAFKYQRPVTELAGAARVAADYMDVITTSGPRTGEPASVDKIIEMKKALDKKPLAVASGITPENVINYLEFVDYFLVATAISRDFYELDPGRVKQLVENIRNFACS